MIIPQFHNTATRKKEKLSPLSPPHVLIYTCGPTIYDVAHIGNFRTFLFEDLLRRSLQSFGYTVTQVMNLTDVDDKTIRGANAQKLSLKTFTDVYKKAFFEDLATLRIQPAEHYPAATDYITHMIAMIQKLLDKKIAYQSHDKSIYFSIEKFPTYGALSHLDLKSLEHGASERIATDEYTKDGASDFVLWKAYDAARDGEIFWESPFGKGRPGWHIECSAMATALLGETLDIHVGAVDNIFPHHENEIAQSEACSGKTFAKMWLHAEHLVVDGHKMSKSLGNFFTLRDLLAKGYTGEQIRYLLLQTHYRTQLNFTLAGLEGAKNTLRRLHDFVTRMQELLHTSTATNNPHDLLQTAQELFSAALADDLNTPQALAVLFDTIREVNTLADHNELSQEGASHILSWLRHCDQIFDVIFTQNTLSIPSHVQEALHQREHARKEKQWQEADRLRHLIESQGFLIEDTPQGARLKKA